MSKEEINILLIVLFVIAMLIIGVVLFLFITYNNRKNKLIQEQLETSLKNQKRQHELEHKALRSQMNPHFVHNSLNAIQYYIQRNEVEISENYLAKFSKLMRLFFEYSRRQSITLKSEITLLNKYLEIEKLRFEDSLEYTITIDPKLDANDLFLPPMILQPIVENAINHGIFHKKGKGLITIDFLRINESIFIINIIDNGIGINKAKLLSTNDIKIHKEHSTNVLRERLKLYKESNNWDIDFEIIDRSDYGDETGTKVTLTFNDNLHDN